MSAMLRQSKTVILLSLNAVAILIAGILIACAIWIPKETTLHVVSEVSDDLDEAAPELGLIDPTTDFLEAKQEESVESIAAVASAAAASSVPTAQQASSAGVPAGELWNETALTIYQSADQDICIDSSLSNLGDMYWQTSNPAVIDKFYSQARERLGYTNDRCRFPRIVGTGTTVITAGTYDGARRDTLTVTVVAVPVEQWKREVLALVNQVRAEHGLAALGWGSACEGAAQLRATEIIAKYDHLRPDGQEWSTVCPIPSSGGTSGENLAAGIAAVSPQTVMNLWLNSPTHYANIISDKFTKMAVGFVFDPSTEHKTYWEQFFSTY